MMVLIWFLSSFPRPPEGATEPAIDYSLAGMIGHALEPMLAPIGFNWQMNVALIPGMAAREVAVAALGTVYAIEGGKEAADQIGAGAGQQVDSGHRACRSWPGTSSRRNAPPRWASSSAKPAAGDGCG